MSVATKTLSIGPDRYLYTVAVIVVAGFTPTHSRALRARYNKKSP